MKYSDSLRGYGLETNKRDRFVCRYCGADGKKSFETWLTLSVDHLLPEGDPRREQLEYKVTACRFCNEADNQYFSRALRQGLSFDMTPDQLLERRRPGVLEARARYEEFWRLNVQNAQ